MQKPDYLEIIKNFLENDFEIARERVVPEANLFLDLEMDSIDALDLASRMQSELNVEPNQEELKSIRTIQDVLNYIGRNRREATAA